MIKPTRMTRQFALLYEMRASEFVWLHHMS